jgi:F-type H+-transporting ATPase subunit epsilon
MAMTLHVDIVSIEASLFSGLAEFVVAPALMGEVGIYPMHAPLITPLKAGVIRLKIPFQTEEVVIYVSSGMLEVQSQGVTILSDIAIRETDITAGKLEAETRKAEETMRHIVTAMEYAKMEVELAKSLAQMQGIQRWRQGKRGL